jgi:hypothetical protein
MADREYDQFGDEEYDPLQDELDFGEAGDPDKQQRMADFEAEVAEKIRVLLSRKAHRPKRREAAYWLGESGDPKAITALRKAYLGEKDKQIKRAAAYALGQFKALDQAIKRDRGEPVSDALQRDENRNIVELLTEITLEGRRGRRLPVSTGALLRFQGVLVLLLLILVAANGLLMFPDLFASPAEPATGTPTRVAGLSALDESALDALAEMRGHLSRVEGDVGALQGQFALTADDEGLQLNCALALTAREPYVTPADVELAYPNIAVIGNRLNTALDGAAAAFNIHEQACLEARAPSPEETGEAVAALAATLADLRGIEAAIIATENSINVIPVEDDDDAQTVADPDQPVVEPTATIEPGLVTAHVQGLRDIITRVNERNGANTLLTQYWSDAQQAGRTDGCRVEAPVIPEPYEEISADILAAVPELAEAREQVNLGLTLLREQGWPLFRTACAQNSLTQLAPTGLIVAETANRAFNSANTLLFDVRAR